MARFYGKGTRSDAPAGLQKGEKTHTVSTSWTLRNSGGPRVAAGEQKLISFTKPRSGILENWSESMKSLCSSTKNWSGFYEKLAPFYEKGTQGDAPAHLQNGEMTHTLSTLSKLRNPGGPRVAAWEQKLMSFTKSWSGFHERCLIS